MAGKGQFAEDNCHSDFLASQSTEVQSPAEECNSELSAQVDRHAPLKARSVVVRVLRP